MSSLELGFADPLPRRIDWSAGTAASIALHAAFVVALLLLSPLRQLVVPAPQPIAVEIVTPAQFAALQPQPTAPQLTAPTAPAETPAAPPAEGEARLTPSAPLEPKLPADRTYAATQFFAAGILKEPKMARIRQTLRTIADSERVVQLCNIEGLEQIRRVAPQYDPDTLVSYAMADTVSSGLTLSATGGAFRSRRKWYGVSFQCTASPDYEGVTAFSFKLGDAIPEDQWEEHNLNAEDEDE